MKLLIKMRPAAPKGAASARCPSGKDGAGAEDGNVVLSSREVDSICVKGGVAEVLNGHQATRLLTLLRPSFALVFIRHNALAGALLNRSIPKPDYLRERMMANRVRKKW